MNFSELLSFIVLEDKRLRKLYKNKPDPEKRSLARMVKLTEEVGELADAVLATSALQRPDKLDHSDQNNLAEEFADVMITTL